MSVRDLEPDGSPPGCSLPDLATSSAGEVPSVTLGRCHLAGAQISPQGVEQGFGLLSSQIKAVSRASGRELGLQMSISDMPHHSPASFVSCPPADASLFLSKSSPREGAAPKQLCEGGEGTVRRLESAWQGQIERNSASIGLRDCGSMLSSWGWGCVINHKRVLSHCLARGFHRENHKSIF